jgi:hypothetical protein
MSKNTKIIAIVGGVIIVGILAWMGLTGGGFGEAFEAVGCGGGGAPPDKQLAVDAEKAARKLMPCINQKKLCKRNEKGQKIMEEGEDGEKTCVLEMDAAACKKFIAQTCNDKSLRDYWEKRASPVFKKALKKACK